MKSSVFLFYKKKIILNLGIVVRLRFRQISHAQVTSSDLNLYTSVVNAMKCPIKRHPCMCNQNAPLFVRSQIFILWLSRLLGLVELDGVVNVAQHCPQAVFVLHVQLEKRDHAEAINELGNGLVELVERGTVHDALLGSGVPVLPVLLVGRLARRVVVNQVCVDVDKALEVALGNLALDQIHLAQYVDVGHLEHHHGAHGRQGAREELGAVDDKRGFEQIGSAHADVERARHEHLDQIGEDGDVRVQLNLAGHVEDDEIVLGHVLERVGQEVEVLHEELEAVDEAAVGAEAHLVHDILEADEVLDVDVGLKGKVLGGGVEVDVEAGALVVLEVLDEGGAEGRLAGAGWALCRRRAVSAAGDVDASRGRGRRRKRQAYHDEGAELAHGWAWGCFFFFSRRVFS